MGLNTDGVSQLGRPGLSLDQESRLLSELRELKKRSAEYRAKRRELAIAFDRTEGAIDKAFARVLGKEKPPTLTSAGA